LFRRLGTPVTARATNAAARANASAKTSHGTCSGLGRRLFPCWGRQTVAISDIVREHLIQDFHVRPERVTMVSNGLDTSRFRPGIVSDEQRRVIRKKLGLSSDAVVFGILARLAKVKGHEFFIKAFHQLKQAHPDRNVQGFELGDPFPYFAHPQVYIPITVPRDVAVDVRIFNRLGILVKLFSWDKNKPMKAGSYIRKETALTWNCDNNADEPVESGIYFVQMQSGLYQKTRIARVSKLRMLDEKHPLMGVVHNFRNVPVCTIESGSKFWENRPYGNAAFGYYYKSRMAILYTEGAGVVAGMGDLDNTVAREMASKFLNNVIAFCLSDEDGVAIRP